MAQNLTNVLVPETRLDAVNGMLASIGQSPVNSLDVAGIRDVSIADYNLTKVTREVLSIGWSFNKEFNYPLQGDGNNKVQLPVSVLSLDPSDDSLDYVQRKDPIDGEMRLYDRENHTFFLENTPVEVDVVWSFDFESIPQAARNYISTRAARLFQSQIVGSDILFKFTAQHEQEAFLTLRRQEMKNKDINLLSSIGSLNNITTRR